MFQEAEFSDVPGLILKDFPDDAAPRRPPAADNPPNIDIVEASRLYEEQHGQKPHHAMKLETILSKLTPA